MTKRLDKAVKKQKSLTKKSEQILNGSLGIYMGGQQVVEVPGRNGFVFVRLRDNLSSTVQAYNNQVSPAYNLPVQVHYIGFRYEIIGVDTTRYGSNWSSFTSYLPRHGQQHSLPDDFNAGGGGDVSFIYTRQFMPMMAMPSGSLGGPNLVVNSYLRKLENGNFYYDGITGTPNITPTYVPSGSNAVMVLVYKNYDTGNPSLLVASGSYFSPSITGTSQIIQYLPQSSNPRNIPIVAVRVPSGTTSLGWDNIIDARQWLLPIATGSTGGGGIPEAPIDGNVYGRKNAGWTAVSGTGGGGGTPGGNDGDVQSKNGTALYGDNDFYRDLANKNFMFNGKTIPVASSNDLHLTGVNASPSFAYWMYYSAVPPSITTGDAIQFLAALGTDLSPLALSANTNIGRIAWKGYYGGWSATRAQIVGRTFNAWSGSDQSTELDFYTTPATTTAEVLMMTLRHYGGIKLKVFTTSNDPESLSTDGDLWLIRPEIGPFPDGQAMGMMGFTYTSNAPVTSPMQLKVNDGGAIRTLQFV